MRRILYDTKKIDNMTLGELIDKINAFAPRRAVVLAAAAEMDKREIEFKAREQQRFQEKFGHLKTETDLEEKDIIMLIMQHSEWFAKPRTMKTANAEFGIRKSPDSVKTTDRKAIIKFADENGLDLYASEPVINKAAVLKALKEGTAVPGAELQSGEKGFIKVNTDNLDTELKSQ